MSEGPGKNTPSTDGQFMHTGGWLFAHDNNTVEINLLECTERENFLWDKLDKSVETESQTPAGRVGAILQEKTVKLLLRKR